MKLEFLGSADNLITVRATPEKPIEQIRKDLAAFLFPYRRDVYAVRVTDDHGRKILIRRPKPTPGEAPVRKVMTLQQRATAEEGYMCDCGEIRYPHSEAHHALYRAVTPPGRARR